MAALRAAGGRGPLKLSMAPPFAPASRPIQSVLQPFVTPSIRPLKKSRWAKVKAMMPGATTTT